MIKWNRLDTDCKNKWAMFTRSIIFIGPLSGKKACPSGPAPTAMVIVLEEQRKLT